MTIGIGLNTAMFTAFNAVGLRGWPVENADSLVLLNPEGPGAAGRFGFGLDDLRDIQQRSRSLEVVAASRIAFHAVSIDPDRRRQNTSRPIRHAGLLRRHRRANGDGPRLPADEDRDGAPANVIIISHGLWQRLFAGAADVIGKSSILAGHRTSRSPAKRRIPAIHRSSSSASHAKAGAADSRIETTSGCRCKWSEDSGRTSVLLARQPMLRATAWAIGARRVAGSRVGRTDRPGAPARHTSGRSPAAHDRHRGRACWTARPVRLAWPSRSWCWWPRSSSCADGRERRASSTGPGDGTFARNTNAHGALRRTRARGT